MDGLVLPGYGLWVVGSMEPWALKSFAWCVDMDGVTYLASNVGLVLPERLHINALFDGVKGVVKNDVKLRRDVAGLWAENQSNRMSVPAGLTKIDPNTGALTPLGFALDGALERGIQNKDRPRLSPICHQRKLRKVRVGQGLSHNHRANGRNFQSSHSQHDSNLSPLRRSHRKRCNHRVQAHRAAPRC